MRSRDLEVIDGASAGAWIKPRLGGQFGAVTLQVPDGFEAYARVFHPARDAEWNSVRWAEVAEFFGAKVHREMQWHAIVGLHEPGRREGSVWPGQEPSIGEMDFDDLDALCELLAAHTADPEHIFYGVCVIENWEESFTREQLKNPLLRLPLGRDHIVLSGPLSAIDQIDNDGGANPGPARMCFTLAARSSNGAPAPDSRATESPSGRNAPNLIWPADHSWLVASEVDFDSTLVGGSAELIEAVVECPRLEAWRVEPTDSLAADADRVNGTAER